MTLLRRRLFALLLVGIGAGAQAPAQAQTPAPLVVFAAASLSDAMKDIAAAWEAQGNPKPTLSFAASSVLARQMEQGAAASIFASADEEWMDWAAQRHLIAADTRRSLLSNQLVLVVPADHPVTVDIKPGFDLAALLGADGKLALGDPAHVPVGRYAQQALTKLGVWGIAEPRLARADNVRSGLALVERGEAPAGIVYATDARPPAKVAVAGVFPPDSHAPISYPFAVTSGGDTPAARALLAFMAGPDGMTIFARHGFSTE